MSEKLTLLQDLLMKLSSVPGLHFLQDMVHNAGAAKKGMDMKIGDRKNQVDNLRDIGGDAKKLVSRDKNKAAKK